MPNIRTSVYTAVQKETADGTVTVTTREALPKPKVAPSRVYVERTDKATSTAVYPPQGTVTAIALPCMFVIVLFMICWFWGKFFKLAERNQNRVYAVQTTGYDSPQTAVYVQPSNSYSQSNYNSGPEVQYASVSKTTYDQNGYPVVNKKTYENGQVTHEQATYDGKNLTYASVDDNSATFAKITPTGNVIGHAQRTNTSVYTAVQKETADGTVTVTTREPLPKPKAAPSRVYVERTDTATYTAVQKETPQGTVTAIAREPHRNPQQNVYVVRQY
ncbi:UNVERIFIED_CONTAM: hypothetical protein HDU68_003301 [Siphonaria sp. JEL0065]|nr:hypothetical protein HDU68_003301 [Siphonaria sp. JEL0065]